VIAGKKVLAIVPARGGSKGVPGKNILPVGGRPLIEWTVSEAKASRHIDRLVLSSDDDHIMAAALAAGCEVPFRRDAALATDASSTIDVVLDALERLPGFDLVMVLQPTSPLRTTADIDGALERLVASDAPACVSVSEAANHPYWTFRLGGDAQDTLEPFARPAGGLPLRRQDLPAAWCLNGAVYVAHADWFKVNRSFLSDRTLGHPMPVERSLDIDTPEDVERLKQILAPRQPPLPASAQATSTKAQS